jgi:hypothetical protein
MSSYRTRSSSAPVTAEAHRLNGWAQEQLSPEQRLRLALVAAAEHTRDRAAAMSTEDLVAWEMDLEGQRCR